MAPDCLKVKILNERDILRGGWTPSLSVQKIFSGPRKEFWRTVPENFLWALKKAKKSRFHTFLLKNWSKHTPNFPASRRQIQTKRRKEVFGILFLFWGGADPFGPGGGGLDSLPLSTLQSHRSQNTLLEVGNLKHMELFPSVLSMGYGICRSQ